MRSRRRSPITEINITPFTDVVLVLLIIFVVIAPIMFKYDINVSLPQTSNANKSGQTQAGLSFTITGEDDLFINGKKFNVKSDADSILRELKTVFAGNPAQDVMINGDKRCKYETVMSVISLLSKAGAKKILLGVELAGR